MLGERHNQARPQELEVASNEDRTRDLALTKRMLCQLSYRGESPAGCTATKYKITKEKRIAKSELRPSGLEPESYPWKG